MTVQTALITEALVFGALIVSAAFMAGMAFKIKLLEQRLKMLQDIHNEIDKLKTLSDSPIITYRSPSEEEYEPEPVETTIDYRHRTALEPLVKVCSARESGGAQCELPVDHKGPHRCPISLARYDLLRGKH